MQRRIAEEWLPITNKIEKKESKNTQSTERQVTQFVNPQILLSCENKIA